MLGEFEEERRVLTEVYREIISCLNEAIVAIAGKKGLEKVKGIAICHRNLVHVREVISLVIESVDPNEGMVSSNLWRLYWFSYLKVVEGNLRKDTVLMEEARDIFIQLLEGYASPDQDSSHIPTGVNIPWHEEANVHQYTKIR